MSVQKIIDALNKRKNAGRAVLLGEGSGLRSSIPMFVETGIDVLDNLILGAGGVPSARIIEVFGPEGCGKSSLTYQLIGQIQKIPDAYAVLCETEVSLDGDRAKTFGVDPDRLIVTQPQHIEGVLEDFETILDNLPPKDKRGPVLFAWDSLAATPTFKEHKNGLRPQKESVGARSIVLSRTCRVLNQLCADHNVIFWAVNQIRDKVGASFGQDFVSPGGRALKFHATIRLCFLGGGAAVKGAGDKRIGQDCTVWTIKNRTASPYQKSKIRLLYDNGWDNVWSTINYAKDVGAVPKAARYDEKTRITALDGLGW